LARFVTPYIIPGANPGGNRTCAEVGEAFFGNAEYYKCSSARVNFPFDGAVAFDDASAECQNDINVTVTNGTYVAWTSTNGVGAVIVKGSSDANVYVYDPQGTSDSGLASPINASGSPAGLSNLTFCWNPDNQEPQKCFEDETAWAAGTRYTSRGNWATYTQYTGVAKTVTLYAGQTLVAGTVNFSAPAGGQVTITITLNAGWRFALNPVGEDANGDPIYDNNIKVQDYSTPPSGNPSPGLFAWKTVATGSVGVIQVPQNNYYGVHSDVEREVECPE
jgi:hypothetical protein